MDPQDYEEAMHQILNEDRAATTFWQETTESFDGMSLPGKLLQGVYKYDQMVPIKLVAGIKHYSDQLSHSMHPNGKLLAKKIKWSDVPLLRKPIGVPTKDVNVEVIKLDGTLMKDEFRCLSVFYTNTDLEMVPHHYWKNGAVKPPTDHIFKIVSRPYKWNNDVVQELYFMSAHDKLTTGVKQVTQPVEVTTFNRTSFVNIVYCQAYSTKFFQNIKSGYISDDINEVAPTSSTQVGSAPQPSAETMLLTDAEGNEYHVPVGAAELVKPEPVLVPAPSSGLSVIGSLFSAIGDLARVGSKTVADMSGASVYK